MLIINTTSKVVTFFTGQSRQSKTFWFSLSLVFATIYGLLAIQQAFSSDYVVQDDARQHIFWMQRYLDPDLFPGDLIADYFQAVAPMGYAGLYKVMAALGIEPDFFSKILPLFLGLITAGYCFVLSLEIFPIPLSAFISSILFSQSLWCSNELSSGTPRAFLYPLLLAFLYYLLRQSRLICLILIGLQVIFYPAISLISLGLVAIRLIYWKDRKISLSENWKDYLLFAGGFCLVLGLVLYTKSLSEFGPIVTRSEAVTMPEFQVGGRNAFFRPGIDYWLGGRSGIFHGATFTPVTLTAGLALPLLLGLPVKTKVRKQVSSSIYILLQLLLTSLILYSLAHLLLFQLHLPNRYPGHTIRIISAITSGISWTIILDDTFRFCKIWRSKRKAVSLRLISTFSQILPLALTIILLITIFFYYPLFIKNFPKAGYLDFSNAQSIYEFFATQPKNILIASLSGEADNLQTFSARSVLVSREHSYAYHKGYYTQIRQRAEDLISAQYSDDPSTLLRFIQAYDIDFWLLDKNAFTDAYISENSWLNQFQPMANDAASSLKQSINPILKQSIGACTVLDTLDWFILDADCIHEFASASRP
ncbi:MAG: hypothetical protein GDA44_14635 [Prochloron sp. SP5CPC1]|nr:hypothetical protein [Candidatus Paraprochloron terpiosi SP5CPC1]